MISYRNFCTTLALCLTCGFALGQYEIKPVAGYSPQIGFMVDMLEDLKSRITSGVRDLNQQQTDFLFDADANSIGALIMHLAATESYYLTETLEGRSWTAEEAALWETASGLGPESRKEFQDKPITYYLDLWDGVRAKTLAGLKARDDQWFASEIEPGINNHWAWFHVMEHQANHMGQIELIKNRFAK
jgi:hypothetical protein